MDALSWTHNTLATGACRTNGLTEDPYPRVTTRESPRYHPDPGSHQGKGRRGLRVPANSGTEQEGLRPARRPAIHRARNRGPRRQQTRAGPKFHEDERQAVQERDGRKKRGAERKFGRVHILRRLRVGGSRLQRPRRRHGRPGVEMFCPYCANQLRVQYEGDGVRFACKVSRRRR